MQWLSRGKFDCLPRTTAGFTTGAFDGYGLRRPLSLRPAPQASNPVLVHRLACLLYASFRPRLATRPLRFAITSRPSRCEEDLHLQAIDHARHTQKKPHPNGCGSSCLPCFLAGSAVHLAESCFHYSFVAGSSSTIRVTVGSTRACSPITKNSSSVSSPALRSSS